MNSETFDDGGLPYVLTKPDGFDPTAAYSLVILLHGFGAGMRDLASLAPVIDPTGYVYAFPDAPYRVHFGPVSTGRSWMTDRPGVEPPPEGAPTLDAMLDAFVADVIARTGAQPGRIALGGFSQGGGQTLRYGLPRPQTFAALAVLSGAFRSYEETRRKLPPPEQRRQSIFVAQGSRDQTVEPERGLEIKAFLEEAGYTPAYHEYPIRHEIAPAELRDLTAWLHQSLPPKEA